MNFHILTLFPDMIKQGVNTSILGRALDNGYITLETVDIRSFTENKHGKVDDYPYGGGAGMLMQAQPVYDAYQYVAANAGQDRRLRVIYVTPQGQCFQQQMAEELAKEEELVFLCGHYEGVDERVLEEIVTDYVSIGDYVLTGGELPAMVMIDAIARLIPGVLNNADSAETESFHNHLLEYPQFSRPEEWRGKKVPEVLLSGNHKNIAAWRLQEAAVRTRERRPDLYEQYARLQDCKKYLMRQKLLHIGMIELINRGQAKLVCMSPEGVLLQDTVSGVLMLTAQNRQAGEAMLAQYKSLYKESITLFVTHQSFMNQTVEEQFGLTKLNECFQAVYTRGTPLRMNKNITVKRLDESYLKQITTQYHVTEEAYIKRRIRSGWLYGAFLKEELAGFIGMHEEGSMGILEVFAQYRKQGIATALESYMINHMLKLNWIPFCQIYTDNQVSIQLQQKLGLYLSKEKICWYVK